MKNGSYGVLGRLSGGGVVDGEVGSLRRRRLVGLGAGAMGEGVRNSSAEESEDEDVAGEGVRGVRCGVEARVGEVGVLDFLGGMTVVLWLWCERFSISILVRLCWCGWLVGCCWRYAGVGEEFGYLRGGYRNSAQNIYVGS